MYCIIMAGISCLAWLSLTGLTERPLPMSWCGLVGSLSSSQWTVSESHWKQLLHWSRQLGWACISTSPGRSTTRLLAAASTGRALLPGQCVGNWGSVTGQQAIIGQNSGAWAWNSCFAWLTSTDLKIFQNPLSLFRDFTATKPLHPLHVMGRAAEFKFESKLTYLLVI